MFSRSRAYRVGIALAGLAVAPAWAAASDGAQALGRELPIWTVAPFIALLLCIAVLPLFAGHWWEHNKNKAIIAVILAAPVAIYFLTHGDAAKSQLLHALQEYISFIVLLGSLFVISGGIYVQGSLSGTPLLNTAILAFGAVIANLVGTTGASVLLIRPLLRANAPRQKKVHVVVFFIFIVSNCGGLLTPLGDPPLFLGFLRGVPFEWTLQLWPQWLLVNGVLLALFNIWDQIVLAREERLRPGSQLEEVMIHESLRVRGLHNILFLAGIVATIYAAGMEFGMSPATSDEQQHVRNLQVFGLQAGLMTICALLAYVTTASKNRTDNRFTFGPIIEVAVLFIGIFVTMVPAVAILNARGNELGLTKPWHFFWATGALSSFLDNAPTYATFAAAVAGGGESLGLTKIAADGPFLRTFLEQGPSANLFLAAISCGAVFMGANTYIGNGPNFMVKAIAEENGVAMPTFFGYMLYSCTILLPIFAIVTWVFFI